MKPSVALTAASLLGPLFTASADGSSHNYGGESADQPWNLEVTSQDFLIGATRTPYCMPTKTGLRCQLDTVGTGPLIVFARKSSLGSAASPPTEWWGCHIAPTSPVSATGKYIFSVVSDSQGQPQMLASEGTGSEMSIRCAPATYKDGKTVVGESREFSGDTVAEKPGDKDEL